MPTKLTDEDRQEIRLRYDLGLSTHQLAERFGVSAKTIRRLLPERRPAGPTIGPSARKADVRDDVVVRLRDVDGLSWARVGAAVGMSWSGARNRYQRAKRRAQSDSGVTHPLG